MTLDPNTIQNLMFFFGGITVAAVLGVIENRLVTAHLEALMDVTTDLMVAYQKQIIMIKELNIQLGKKRD